MRPWLLAAALLVGAADAVPNFGLPLEQQVVTGTGDVVHDATLAARCGLRPQAMMQRVVEASARMAIRTIRDDAVATGINGNAAGALAFARATVLMAQHAAEREFLYYGQVACRTLGHAGTLKDLDGLVRLLDERGEP